MLNSFKKNACFMVFSYQQGVKAANMQECTRERLLEAISSEATVHTVASIRTALAEGRKEEADRLKRTLPAVTWQALAPEGERRNDVMVPSGLYMLDVDHVPNARELALKAAEHEGLGIVAVYVTPSGEGIRVVAKTLSTSRTTIAANQQWLAEQLNVEYDHGCKDFARLAFLVGAEDFTMLDMDAIYGDAEYILQNPYTSTSVTAPSPSGEVTHTDCNGIDLSEYQYDEYSLNDLTQIYLERFGIPRTGMRHTYYYTMSNNFRYITNNNPEVLFNILPSFELPESERRSMCKSVCSHLIMTLPKEIKSILSDCNIGMGYDATSEQEGTPSRDQQQAFLHNFPPLPPIFDVYVGGAPDDFKYPLVAAILPILGTYCTRARAEFNDCEQTTTFHSVIYAPQSSGKSRISQIQNELVKLMADNDDVQYKIENEYESKKK